jgi:hypothetical protein
MKSEDRYHKWVEWSDEDRCYIGRCPDLFLGGCHGDNALKVYQQLCSLVKEEILDLRKARRSLPQATVRPMQEITV